MNDNYFRLAMLSLFVCVYIFDFMPILIREVFYKKFNPVRAVSAMILASLVVSLITMIPSLIYQVFEVTHIYVPWFKDFVTITSTVSAFAQLVLVGCVLHYRYKG